MAQAAETQASAQQDHEMEEELAAGLKDDPLSAYDVDVSVEGSAIKRYLQLICENEQGNNGSLKLSP